MSNADAIGLIGALLIAGGFLMFHAAITIRNSNAGILGGVVAGAPIPDEFRLMTIWQVQLPVTASMGVIALLVAFVFVRIADLVEDPATATLAQTCALAFFGASALFLVSAPVSFRALSRLIRKTKAD